MSVPKQIPKLEYRKILYTTDLSESGRYAFHHAASLSRQYGSEITVLHVVEGGPELDRRLFGYVDEKLWDEIKTRNLKEARDILISRKRDDAAIRDCVGRFCDEVREGIPDEAKVEYKVVVKMGEPAEEIVKEAETGDYDLVVMGSYGYGALKRAIMGDTVRQVLGRSRIPVLVIRVPGEED